jgi:hypothetical protein
MKKNTKELIKKLNFPKNPSADWNYTNHYEITGINDYFWMDVLDKSVFASTCKNPSASIEGQKIGLLMDLACSRIKIEQEIRNILNKGTIFSNIKLKKINQILNKY